MRGLDDTDREILRLLLADARRPFSDIADRVDLSAPAVSDRVERLREMGLIRRFTLDVDRSMLRSGVPVLVELTVQPDEHGVAAQLGETDGVEHVFETADGTVVCSMTVPDGEVRPVLAESIDLSAVESLDVSLLAGQAWRPGLGEADLAAECAECGNTVTSEGESATLGGTVYQFCCPNCKAAFVDQYERFKEGA